MRHLFISMVSDRPENTPELSMRSANMPSCRAVKSCLSSCPLKDSSCVRIDQIRRHVSERDYCIFVSFHFIVVVCSLRMCSLVIQLTDEYLTKMFQYAFGTDVTTYLSCLFVAPSKVFTSHYT